VGFSVLQTIQDLINKGCFLEALKLIEEIKNVQGFLENFLIHSQKITALLGLARYHEALEVAKELLEFIDKAITSAEQVNVINEYKLSAMQMLSTIYSMLGNHEETLNILKEIVSYPKLFTFQEFQIKIALAMEYASLGDFPKSIEILQDELSKTQDKTSQIEFLLALGDVYRYFIQDLKKSREFYYKAYNLSLNADDEIKRKAFERYVDLLLDLGDKEQAKDFLNELLQESISELEKAKLLENLAIADNANARTYLESALEIYRKLGLRREEANVLFELSNVEENIEKSIELLKQAISIVESSGMKQFSFLYRNGLAYKLYVAKKYDEAKSILNELIVEKEISKFLLAYCYVGLATINKEEGNYDNALDMLYKAEQILDETRYELTWENRIDFSNTYSTVKREAVRFLLKTDIKLALRKSEEAKARSLVELVSLHKIPKPSNEEIFDIEQKLTAELNAAMKSSSPYIKEIYKRLETIWSSLETNPKYKEYLSLRKGYIIDINEVCNFIDDETAIVDYLILPDQLLVFIISKKDLDIVKVSKNKSVIYDLFIKFKEFEKIKDVYINEKLIKEASNILISPIEEKIKKYKHLCISPDLVLYYVPFHALYFEGKELIESKTLSYIPNLTLLKYCSERESKGDCLVIGGSPTNDLIYAVQESKEIAELLKTEVRNYTKKEIIEKMKSSKVISFSCHAFYSSRDYGLGSYIILPNGEYLTSKEILETRLNSELVTLSACETAKLSYFEGGDIFGLLSSFLCAGAKSIVASLWKLNDHAAYLTMKEFYTRLTQGSSKAEALRSAQLITKREYPNPYHWSPLLLVGEYSSILDINRK
jgi:CHAT domain-containing protein